MFSPDNIRQNLPEAHSITKSRNVIIRRQICGQLTALGSVRLVAIKRTLMPRCAASGWNDRSVCSTRAFTENGAISSWNAPASIRAMNKVSLMIFDVFSSCDHARETDRIPGVKVPVLQRVR